MASNPAADGFKGNSPHVMTATGVDRGSTPAVWNAVEEPTVTGVWKDINTKSGPANLEGHVTEDFEEGPAPWKQT